MKFLVLSSILAFAICANAYIVKDDPSSDKDMFLRIIECAQKGIINGIEEIGLPSHDPLRISHNFSAELPVLNYNVSIALENMIMEGIPWWNVTQLDDVTEEPDVPVFDYTIYWKVISFEGDWRVEVVDTESGDQVLAENGDFGFELDHLTFSGLFNFSKPAEGVEAGFNNITLLFHTEESELHFNGLGLVSSLIKSLGGQVLADAVNSNALVAFSGPAIMDKLNRDWVKKPERIEALISHCNDPTA